MDINKLTEALLKHKVRLDFSGTFAQLTTVGCGGRIAVTAYPSSVRQLVRCLKTAQKMRVPCVVVGKGSNLLAGDGFFEGLVIVTKNVKNIRQRGRTLTCECGAHTGVIATYAANEGLAGCEFMYCLPATVGGAAAMNAGCFGQSMADVVLRVKCFHRGRVRHLSGKRCAFVRRGSFFRQSGAVVLSVTVRLVKSDRQTVWKKCRELFEKKAKSQPLKEKSFGCAFFDRKGNASRLIDEAGLKGMRVGGAQVSEKHAGFLINVDNCTANDIYLLMKKVQGEVFRRFSERLEEEVVLVNVGKEDDIRGLPHAHEKQ